MSSVLLFDKHFPVKPLGQERAQAVRSGCASIHSKLAQPALVSRIDTACIGSLMANSVTEGSAPPGERHNVFPGKAGTVEPAHLAGQCIGQMLNVPQRV